MSFGAARTLVALTLLTLLPAAGRAQPTRAVVTTRVVEDSAPVADAVIRSGMARTRTNANGVARAIGRVDGRPTRPRRGDR